MQSRQHTFQLLLFICFLATTPVIAQNNFHSGYIITNSNDTLHGYITQVNVNLSQKCYFKKTTNGELIKYSPEDIHAYRIDNNGKFYISKQVPLETGKKLYFLEFLIQGKANIYYMRDDMDHFFVETENDTIIELSERQKLEKNEWGTTYYKQPAFQGKLKYLFKDCPAIYTYIDKIKLHPKELISVAKEYHEKICGTEQCIIFERKISPLKVHFGLIGGISLNRFSFGTLSRTNFRPNALIGCKIEFENLFYSSEQSTINTGLILQSYSNYSESQYQYGDFTNFIRKENIDVKAMMLRIPITYNYTISLSKIRPYVGAGFTNTFVLKQNKSFSGNFLIPKGQTFNFYQLGGIGLAGIKFMLKNKKTMNVELNCEYDKDLSVDSKISLVNKSLSLIVGYTF